MDCQNVRDRLAWYIVGQLGERERDAVEEHLAGCAACRWRLENLRVTLGESRPQPGLREELDARIRAEIARTHRREQRLRWTARAAAVLAIGLALGLWHHRRQGSSEAEELHEVWRHSGISSTHTTTADAPAICGGNVYGVETGADGRHVVSLDAGTGRPKWKSDAAVIGYLAADAFRVYAVGAGPKRRPRLLALDAEDGRVLWSHDPERRGVPGVTSRPLLLDARLCWCHGCEAMLVDAQTGEKIWTQAFPKEGTLSRPVAQGGRIWVATAKSLHALDVADGRVVRSTILLEESIRPSPPLLAVSGSRCYVATRSGPNSTRLLCYDDDRDRLVWDTAVATIVHLQVFGDTVIARSDCLRAWDGANGRLLWAYSAKGCSPVSPIGDSVCFVDVEGAGALVTLEARTGRLIGRYAGKPSCAGFVVEKGIGYLNAQDGVLYAMRMDKA